MSQPYPVKAPKKLIEVALPLDAINAEAALRKRKAPGGYPTTLHSWWAQRPVAAARAVIFAQLVNDPSWKWELESPGKVPPNNLKASWAAKRKQLFALLSELVLWESTTNEDVLERAREEIRKSWREVCELNRDHPQAAELFNPEKLPGLHDPFAGGGTIPLEAQRMGLEAYASDLNPVAVLINKAMIEVPPRFAGRAPVGPLPEGAQESATTWPRASGLAEDVRRYGAWIRAEAEKRIGHLYPKVEVTAEVVQERPDLKPLKGRKLTVVAWLWARTVKSPNPAFSHVDVPLASTFVLSSKEGKESYVQPVVKGDSYRFTVKDGKPPASAKGGTTAGKRSAFLCIMSGNTAIGYDYIRAEGKAGRMGQKLMAVVAEGERGRVYLDPDDQSVRIAAKAKPEWAPDLELPDNPRDFKTPNYGFTKFGDLFTPRQLVALTTFSDLVGEARERVKKDSLQAGIPDDGKGLDAGGTGATAYSEALALLLGFSLDRVADYGSSICTWRPKDNAMRATLGKQAIPMSWDFAEGSPFARSSSGFLEATKVIARAVEMLPCGPIRGGASQAGAQSLGGGSGWLVSTDPPYYNNIGYADLSDFFYVWLRRTVRAAFPGLLSTIATPKGEELVATPYRHGGDGPAERFFLKGMTEAMRRLVGQSHPAVPTTIYYAFKQAETKAQIGTSSTGWETFLGAVHSAGFSVTGTWPVRTEADNRQVGNKANALASSIVLVCRPRLATAPAISRRDFIRELNLVLPEALDEMTKGAGEDRSPVAPVDLSQAIIGPGMAVFSKYSAVLEADGSPMSVKSALQLINRFLAEDDFDADTQFCLHWFEQYAWGEGLFGEADNLARAKATSVDGLNDAGVLFSGKGKVRLRKWSDYPRDWDPRTDKRLPIWEALHQLIRALKQDGESGAGKFLADLGPKSEAIRQLAYRLYTLCERQGRSEDARAYNELVTSWSGIETQAAQAPKREGQLRMFDDEG